MTPDGELLRRFAESRSEDAFAELVSRHLNLVHSAALRQVNGDTPLAQDVAQMVFVDLARKAAALSRRPVLAGWLYTSTRFAAAKVVRAESRRHAREQEAHLMRDLPHETVPDVDWDRLRRLLDEAMHQLKQADREAILLRYFEKRPLAEIGARFGVNENAARMRVERALEKLRAQLSQRGLATTAAALSAAITVNAVQTAPAGLAATLTGAALATAAASGTTLALLLLNMTTLTQLKLGIGALALAGAAALWVGEHRLQMRLRGENESLSQLIARLQTEKDKLAGQLANPKLSVAPRLPAPPLPTAAPPSAAAEELQSSNLLRFLNGEHPKLTREQIEAYLTSNHRSAASLLAVFRATNDNQFLKEAEEKFPDDPRVDFAAAFKTDSSEAQRQWLDHFKRSAPDNAMANYLSALNYFKSGQTDQAVQELTAAAGKTEFQDYSWDFVQNAEETWRAAGYPEAQTSMIATWDLVLPQDAELKQLNQKILDLAGSYRQAGDDASAQAAVQMGLVLGRQMNASQTDPLINQLVGIAIQRSVLETLDPHSSFGADGQTVQDQLNQLAQQKTAIHDLVQQSEPFRQIMSAQDWINYNDRTRAFGEVSAMQWLIAKYRQP